MIRTKDELLTIINERFSGDETDEVISFIEDVTDTLDDLTAKAADSTNWQERYNQLDADWRKRYKERFFTGEDQPEDEEEFEEDEKEEKTTYEDLFKED